MLYRGEAPQGLGNLLMRANSVEDLRALAPLPDEAQRLFDRTLISVGLERLVLVGDLLQAGLTMPVGDPLSVLEVYWEKGSRSGSARRMMHPQARGENQRQDRSGNRLPIYATLDDFSMNIRTLRASERASAPLDTSQVAQANRNVNEAVEDAAWNGAGISTGTFSTPGVLTAPNVSTQSFVGNESWTASGHDGEDILVDLLNMINQAHANKKYGPYNLYVPTAYGVKLWQDFKANSDKSIMSRLREIEAGGRPINIRVADLMPADTVALIQMTSDVIDLVMGSEPTLVSWDSPSGWDKYFAVLAFMVPRVRDDYEGNSGIVIGTPNG